MECAGVFTGQRGADPPAVGSLFGCSGLIERDDLAVAGSTALKLVANLLGRGRLARATVRKSATATANRGFIWKCYEVAVALQENEERGR